MKTVTAALLVAGAALFAQEIPSEARQKIESALPAKAPANPKQPRKLLVLTLHVADGKPVRGHASIPYAKVAFEDMGHKTGAYEAVFTEDAAALAPATLARFDAVCFLNTAGVLTEDAALRRSLLEFVRGGKGFIAVHAGGGATFVQWPKYDQFPEFGEMVGGYENGGHPWKPDETITLKLDDPKSPINASFGGKGFQIADEVFQFQAPYSREKLHVLLSIDTAHTDMNPARRFLKERLADDDFAISWIKPYGKGRVFQTALGHNAHIYWNAPVLAHFLAGIQYALGDLKADATPSAKAHP
jgi:type 1 glutamine amidotransferase